jgi:dolichol kinase
VAIVVMIHKIPLIWFLSIEKIFGIPQNAIWMVTGICIILVDISLKIFLLLNEAIKNTQTSHSQKKEILRQIIYLIFGDVLAIIIFSI